MEKYLASVRYEESTIVRKRLFKMDDTTWNRYARECGGFVIISFPLPVIGRAPSEREEYIEPKQIPDVYVYFNHLREHNMIDLEEDLRNNSFSFQEVLGGFDPQSQDQNIMYESVLVPYASFVRLSALNPVEEPNEQVDFGNVRYRYGEDNRDAALEFVLKMQSLARKHQFYHMVVCMPKYFKNEAVSFNTFQVDDPYPLLNGDDEKINRYSLEDVCYYYRTNVTFNDGNSYGIFLTRGNLDAISFFNEEMKEVDLFMDLAETYQERNRREKREKKEAARKRKELAKAEKAKKKAQK